MSWMSKCSRWMNLLRSTLFVSSDFPLWQKRKCKCAHKATTPAIISQCVRFQGSIARQPGFPCCSAGKRRQPGAKHGTPVILQLFQEGTKGPAFEFYAGCPCAALLQRGSVGGVQCWARTVSCARKHPKEGADLPSSLRTSALLVACCSIGCRQQNDGKK